MFNPDLIDVESKTGGIGEMVFRMIQQADMDTRPVHSHIQSQGPEALACALAHAHTITRP